MNRKHQHLSAANKSAIIRYKGQEVDTIETTSTSQNGDQEKLDGRTSKRDKVQRYRSLEAVSVIFWQAVSSSCTLRHTYMSFC